MKAAIKIDLVKGIVELNDGSIKNIDNYIFELEDRFIKLQDILKDYVDVDPNAEYMILGEMLFNIMDIIENRK
jgi:hypothetical protein